jgi:hypothetical protein
MYTFLNIHNEEMTTLQEIRDYFKVFTDRTKVTFVGGYPTSYVVLTDRDHEAIEIITEFCGETDKTTDSDYWFQDDENDENSYNTFLDQFSVIELWDLKTLKENVRKLL